MSATSFSSSSTSMPQHSYSSSSSSSSSSVYPELYRDLTPSPPSGAASSAIFDNLSNRKVVDCIKTFLFYIKTFSEKMKKNEFLQTTFDHSVKRVDQLTKQLEDEKKLLNIRLESLSDTFSKEVQNVSEIHKLKDEFSQKNSKASKQLIAANKEKEKKLRKEAADIAAKRPIQERSAQLQERVVAKIAKNLDNEKRNLNSTKTAMGQVDRQQYRRFLNALTFSVKRLDDSDKEKESVAASEVNSTITSLKELVVYLEAETKVDRSRHEKKMNEIAQAQFKISALEDSISKLPPQNQRTTYEMFKNNMDSAQTILASAITGENVSVGIAVEHIDKVSSLFNEWKKVSYACVVADPAQKEKEKKLIAEKNNEIAAEQEKINKISRKLSKIVQDIEDRAKEILQIKTVIKFLATEKADKESSEKNNDSDSSNTAKKRKSTSPMVENADNPLLENGDEPPTKKNKNNPASTPSPPPLAPSPPAPFTPNRKSPKKVMPEGFRLNITRMLTANTTAGSRKIKRESPQK